MDSDSEIPLTVTLTPNSQDTISQTGDQVCPKVWGRLFSRKVYLKSIDLLKDIYSFGKLRNCDVVFSRENFQEKHLKVISKLQFKINFDEGNAFIEDCSKNGTFVNNSLVGQEKTLLQNDDEISMGISRLAVYVFKKFTTEENSYLPIGLRSKYEISRILGHGAFGEVRLAFSKNTNEQFAIKKIIKGKASSLGNYDRLHNTTNVLNEVNILKSLAHPCIIIMHDMLETDTAVFMVLEYMAGGELTRLITSESNFLTEESSKLIFYQIALGVQYLHKKGITHRDLKPGNILLKSEDLETIAKVSDFGLSKVVHDNIFMATICGTPVFVAPEVIDITHTRYDQQIDVWSLGVLLFYMISKELPFNARFRSELVRRILQAEYEMDDSTWKGISENAKCLVRQMLVKDPQMRIKIDDIVKHPWFFEGDGVHHIFERLTKEFQYERTSISFSDLHNCHFNETMPMR